ADELPTEVWLRVLAEAADLGVLQVHLSGGEPLARADLAALVERATALELYTNLITSGLGLPRARAQALRDAGLGAAQLSIQAAEREVARFRERAGDTMEILWVIPDYHAEFPKPCMNGWARMFLTVAPDGTALPCPAASVIPGLDPPSVRQHSTRWIWFESPA